MNQNELPFTNTYVYPSYEPQHLYSEQLQEDCRIKFHARECKTGVIVYDKSLPFQSNPDSLYFDSNFESGNLQRAIKISEQEYDLLITPDYNTKGHTQ